MTLMEFLAQIIDDDPQTLRFKPGIAATDVIVTELAYPDGSNFFIAGDSVGLGRFEWQGAEFHGVVMGIACDGQGGFEDQAELLDESVEREP